MNSHKLYKQPSITTYFSTQCASNNSSKISAAKYEDEQHRPSHTAFPFPFPSNPHARHNSLHYNLHTKSATNHESQYPECKDSSNSPSPSPSPSPTPTTLLSNLHLYKEATATFTYSKYRNTKKRKLAETEHGNEYQQSAAAVPPNSTRSQHSGSCLKKVTLSDGSVCYTMVSSAHCAEPPTKKVRSNSYSAASSSSAPHGGLGAAFSCSQPPAKKRRPNSCNTLIRLLPHQQHGDATQVETECEPQRADEQEEKEKTNKSVRPKLVYSQTMPIPTPAKKDSNEAKRRKRRHSGDWTSKDQLLESLQQQSRMEEELFPSHHIPDVNLKEMFNGLKMIRVHKKLRPINLRRETQLFQ